MYPRIATLYLRDIFLLPGLDIDLHEPAQPELLEFPAARPAMKSATEVLLMKELELERLKKEIEALRLTAKLLGEEKQPVAQMPQKYAKVVQLP
ncbi:MAG: hypothetical protein DMG70_16660 [Acidobacteria bacterium]|nr:MAG: hypothetical protein DMG70_16660 [Acidobacteriota bacterium]